MADLQATIEKESANIAVQDGASSGIVGLLEACESRQAKETWQTCRQPLRRSLQTLQFKDGAIHDLAGWIAADGCISSSDGASSGIVGLLQVCESCFSTSFPKTKTAEESAISTCETDTKQNEIEKATKEQDVKYKTKEAGSLSSNGRRHLRCIAIGVCKRCALLMVLAVASLVCLKSASQDKQRNRGRFAGNH